MFKRVFDFVFSLLALVLLSPFILCIAVFMKLDSKGPVFYKGGRVGQDGKLFGMYKFRTMREDADSMGGGPSCADDDPRITRFGKIARKYKLNEIPQLINVLKGEMSFVGPRPEVKMYTDMFTEEEKVILSVKPGITDWASLWNSDEGELLKGKEDPEKYYMEHIRPEKLRLQLKYVRERSFLGDLKILWRTAKIFLEPLARRNKSSEESAG